MKRCPHCKDEPVHGRDFEGIRIDMVYCLRCGLNSSALPVDVWNCRPIEDELQEKITELEAEVERLRNE